MGSQVTRRERRRTEKQARAYLADTTSDGGRCVDRVAEYLRPHFPDATLAQRRAAVVALRSSCSSRFEAFPESNGAPAGMWLVDVASDLPLTLETYGAAITRGRKWWRRVWPT